MNYANAVLEALDRLELPAWRKHVQQLMVERLSPSGHGDFERWNAVLERLPGRDAAENRELLLRLAPWRKGPFDVGGVEIDAEWRSDMKWRRVCEAVESFDGRDVLDVGCGNGYYALEIAAAGARNVIGIDPTILFVMQFQAVNRFAGAGNVHVVPARLEELPLPAARFDTTLSMGVLYHRRSPLDHLRQLHATLRHGGQLLLETIYLPGDTAFARTPPGRYARMRNVWLLPSLPELQVWLQKSGFDDIDVIETSVTTVEEQRRTDWMTFESLAEALDPDDSSKTVEGWPAPHRVVITATRN